MKCQSYLLKSFHTLTVKRVLINITRWLEVDVVDRLLEFGSWSGLMRFWQKLSNSCVARITAVTTLVTNCFCWSLVASVGHCVLKLYPGTELLITCELCVLAWRLNGQFAYIVVFTRRWEFAFPVLTSLNKLVNTHYENFCFPCLSLGSSLLPNDDTRR